MYQLKNKNQLDATYYFIVLLISSTCFGHYYAHHQELTTIMLIITLVVSFCKDGKSSVNVKLWFLVVYVHGLGMWRVWVRRGGCIGSFWGNRKEGDHRGDLGVDGWVMLGWISRRWDVGWAGQG